MQALSEYEEGVLSPAQLTPLVINMVQAVQSHGTALYDIKGRVVSIDARVTQVEQHLEVVDGRLDNIEESQRRLEINPGGWRLLLWL